ncbi:N/A [soil metagenome]
MKDLRIGFIGTGWVAEVHAKSLAKIPGITIAALYNHNITKAIAFSEKHAGGKAECFEDWGRMLRTQKLDALYVGLPPGAHVGQTELAAELGIHLMLEKPIALTLERATSIYNAVKKAGVICEIGHHMRHSLPVRKLKQMLLDGTAGKPLMMQGRFFVNGMFPAWWRDPNMGGGQLVEQAIHIYDLARHFMGEPETVCAFADNLFHRRFADYRVDDVSASVIRFKNGSIASLCASNCADPKAGGVKVSVQCEKVIVEFTGSDSATFVHTGGKIADEINRGEGSYVREDVASTQNAYDELSADFIGAIRNGTPLRSGLEDGLESLRLVLAAAKSAKSGGAAQLLCPDLG